MKDRGVDTLSQADLLVHLDAPAITLRLADVLNRLSPSGRWRGDYLDVSAMGEGKAIEVLSNSGSWVAAMREIGAKIDHAIVVDGVNDDNTVRVRDPFDATSYTMRIEDFLSYTTLPFP